MPCRTPGGGYYPHRIRTHTADEMNRSARFAIDHDDGKENPNIGEA